MSVTVGARNTSDIVPRRRRSSIGRHSSASFALVVEPKLE
jgi:hypothetical protein